MTPIATKNNAIILKDGKLAENCGCCEEWYCDQQYGACCNGTQCENKYKCDCASTSTFKNGVPCGGSACYCVFPTLAPLPGAITSIDDPMIGRRLPIYCTLTDGRHSYSGNYTNIQTFFPDAASLLAVYGSEAQTSFTEAPALGTSGSNYGVSVEGMWKKYLATPFTLFPPFASPCCGDLTDGNAYVLAQLICNKQTGQWAMSWSTGMTCFRWTRDPFYGTYSYQTNITLLYSDSGTILIPAASNGLPEEGTHSLASGAGYGTPCENYILNASITISHSA
jgi:hypothetical protein